ncbi:TPR repeat containing exported protein; Putative periplasmic protein contains a protein prenylyltransferase domain [hydrothermal vent metagenome]|uniref:TPR repeat containing exported protein Putative periplasmic protein contains a protein prenylyltransferase domain n=1 Tax=hydrothermal vent metagenome TaxID=652676 RepID=A0A3B0ZPY4_9ZZZZ
MKQILLPVCLLCVLLVDVQLVFARDVQLRSRPSDSTSTQSQSSSNQQSNSTRKLSAEERLQRLERILESQGLVDMLVKIENLQSELQILRGELELHTHQLDEIKQRQRDLYVDIDRRLLRLERNGPGPGSSGATGSTAGATSATATVGAVTSSTATNTKPSTTTGSSTDFAAEQKAYQKAFDLLRELRYEQAVTAFNGFITQFPQGRYAHIAQYWIGEANYAQRNFKQAIIDYQKLIDNYPNSPKLAEAMLKIGYSQYELKKFKQAETTLKQLTKNYPGTTEAGQATNLIQKIRLKR